MPADNLADFVAAVSGEDRLCVEESLGGGFVRLRIAEAERRQARHDIRAVEDIVVEMLRNARDAQAKNVYLALSREADVKTLVFLDDGVGIPASLHELVFEPRVTSKLETMVMDRWGVHGRGMALYSIRCNTLSSQVVSSEEGLGCSIKVEVDLRELPEKADQSTYPKLERDEEGELAVGRGPHNVVRCVVEFALEHRDQLNVYLGSPTDILSRLCERGRACLTDDQLLFCDDVSALPVCLRPAAAADALELVEIAASLGLPISERTAHRIIAGQIEPAQAPLRRVQRERDAKPRPVDIYKDSRGLKVSSDDLCHFSDALERSFEGLARRYYLNPAGPPKIRVGKDAITVSFPFDKGL